MKHNYFLHLKEMLWFVVSPKQVEYLRKIGLMSDKIILNH